MAGTIWPVLVFLLFFMTLSYAAPSKKPITLSEDNWTDMLKGEWLVKFYAPWCPACKAMAETWDKVATWSDDLTVNIAMVDVTENPGLSGRFLVMALPTVYHVKDGEFRTYRGSRDENAFVAYVDEKKWTSEPSIPWWKSPGSSHMAALGFFFKASMAIRSVHSTMTEEYGVPVWGSYALFAIATIIVGLILGVLIVFLCDVIFPAPPPMSPPTYKSQYDLPRDKTYQTNDKGDETDDILDDRDETSKSFRQRKTESAKDK